MKLGKKSANFICLLIATAAFAATFHSHILYVAHHNNPHSENEHQEIHLSHPASEHLSPVSGDVSDRSAAPSNEQ
jgi:hypothetical protein